MKLREVVYVIACTIMWCVACPCWTWITITNQKEETARIQITQQRAAIDAQDRLSLSLDRSTFVLRQALEK